MFVISKSKPVEVTDEMVNALLLELWLFRRLARKHSQNAHEKTIPGKLPGSSPASDPRG